VKALKEGSKMKTIAEQIAAFEATRARAIPLVWPLPWLLSATDVVLTFGISLRAKRIAKPGS
jgi:hypothetical protein